MNTKRTQKWITSIFRKAGYLFPWIGAYSLYLGVHIDSLLTPTSARCKNLPDMSPWENILGSPLHPVKRFFHQITDCTIVQRCKIRINSDLAQPVFGCPDSSLSPHRKLYVAHRDPPKSHTPRAGFHFISRFFSTMKIPNRVLSYPCYQSHLT